jgi:hypothetical protein
MRHALVVGVVLCGALGGCGGGAGSDAASARDTTKAFVSALRSQDGAKACSYLTANGRSTYSQLGDVPCARGVLGAGFATDARIGPARVHGSQATVILEEPSGTTTTLVLKRQGGAWRIDSAG